MTYTREQLQGFIDEIQEHGPDRGLTTWEEGFVDRVAEDLAERGTLSALHIDTLERIYAERTPL